MTQETFEQMATRAYETAMGQELRPQDKAGVLKVLAAFRDELAKGQEPPVWIHSGHLDIARRSAFLCRVEPKERPGFSPIFTHPFVAASAVVMDFEPDAKRLALELECLLLDCKDMAAVSKWWDSAHEALEQHRAMLSAAPAAPADAVEKDAEMLDWITLHGSFGVDSTTGEIGGNGQKRIAATRTAIQAAMQGKDSGNG